MQSIKLKLLYLACCLFIATGLAAQDASYFVYIQHEKQQPFYVKLDGKLLSSSVKGYVILPKMEAGKVPVTIGFPKGEAPEQQFTIRLAGNRDYGYLLKNSGDQEWALYDLQTFASLKSAGAGGAQPAEKPAESEAVAVTRISSDSATPEQKELINNVQADVEAALAKKKAEEKAAGEQPVEETPAPKAEMPADTTPVVAQTAPKADPKKKNSFAESLDKVVTDDRPAEMNLPKPKPAAATEAPVDVSAPAAEPEKPAKKRKKGQRDPLTEEEKELLGTVMEEEKRAAADEALKEAEAAATGESAKESPKEAPKEQPVEEKAPEEKPKKAKKKKEGEPEFIDFGEAPAATPAVAPAATAPEPKSVPAEEEETSAKDAREARRQQKKAAREAADREALSRDSLANVGWHDAAPESKDKKSDLKMVNSDCPKVLETEAFRKLLRTMNSRKTDADMVDAFRKGTRNTCVSTEQVRALAQLISSDENRYQLMDAAYARTYDSDNFSKLSDLLSDNYYKNRFKAMLKR